MTNKIDEPEEKSPGIKRSVMNRRKWKEPKELGVLFDKYFRNTPVKEYTVTGLALHANASRQTIDRYQKREGFTEMIKQAKLKVEHSYEISLKKGGKAGDIFALKNFGWTDQTQVDLTSKGKKLGYVALPDVVEDS